MIDDIKKIKELNPIEAEQFMRNRNDRIDPNDKARDERRGFRANEYGLLDAEFGGSIFPIRIEKIDRKTEKHFFSFDDSEGAVNNDFYLAKKISRNKIEIYDHENNLLETQITEDGITKII